MCGLHEALVCACCACLCVSAPNFALTSRMQTKQYGLSTKEGKVEAGRQLRNGHGAIAFSQRFHRRPRPGTWLCDAFCSSLQGKRVAGRLEWRTGFKSSNSIIRRRSDLRSPWRDCSPVVSQLRKSTTTSVLCSRHHLFLCTFYRTETVMCYNSESASLLACLLAGLA